MGSAERGGWRWASAVLAAFLVVAWGLASAPEAGAEGPGGFSAEGALAQTKPKTTKKKKKKKKKTRRKTTVRRTGSYMLVGVGLVYVDDASRGYADIEAGPGLTLGFGYRFSPQFSLEGGVVLSLHDATEVTPQGSVGASPVQNTLIGGEADLKFWFPIQLPRVEGYGLVSVGYYSFQANRVDGSTFAGIGFGVGGGVDYRFSQVFSLGLRAQVAELFFEEKFVTDDGPDFNDAQAPIFTLMPTAQFQF